MMDDPSKNVQGYISQGQYIIAAFVAELRKECFVDKLTSRSSETPQLLPYPSPHAQQLKKSFY
jgi:hypothetical protein